MSKRFGDESFTSYELADMQYRAKMARAYGRDEVADSLTGGSGYKSAMRDFDSQRTVRRMHSGNEPYLHDGESE